MMMDGGPSFSGSIVTTEEVEYKFSTAHGIMRVKPSNIIDALKEQAEQEEIDIQPPEEDLKGWGIIYATDEEGKQRPLLLMRALPNQYHPPYRTFSSDDMNMIDLVRKEVYKLTPSKIKWIKYKLRIKAFFKALIKR